MNFYKENTTPTMLTPTRYIYNPGYFNPKSIATSQVGTLDTSGSDLAACIGEREIRSGWEEELGDSPCYRISGAYRRLAWVSLPKPCTGLTGILAARPVRCTVIGPSMSPATLP